MTRINGYDIRIFEDEEALSVVLDMPSGNKKEQLAVPISTLQPCEAIAEYSYEGVTYFFLLIIPETRDKRLLISSRNMAELVDFIHFEGSNIMNDPLKESILNLIYNHIYGKV